MWTRVWNGIKVVLSVIALILALFGTGQAIGVYHFQDTTVQILLAAGGALGVIGVAPLPLPANAGKVLSAFAILASAIVMAHTAGKLGGPELLYHIIGIVGSLLGIAGKISSTTSTPPPATPPPAPAT